MSLTKQLGSQIQKREQRKQKIQEEAEALVQTFRDNNYPFPVDSALSYIKDKVQVQTRWDEAYEVTTGLSVALIIATPIVGIALGVASFLTEVAPLVLLIPSLFPLVFGIMCVIEYVKQFREDKFQGIWQYLQGLKEEEDEEVIGHLMRRKVAKEDLS